MKGVGLFTTLAIEFNNNIPFEILQPGPDEIIHSTPTLLLLNLASRFFLDTSQFFNSFTFQISPASLSKVWLPLVSIRIFKDSI